MIGFKKIAALIVGASLSVGVGVGISSIDATSEVRADDTATTVIRDAKSAVSGTATPIAGDSNVTIKTSSANTYFNPCRLYANSTITIAVSNALKYYITSVVYEASSTGNYVTYAEEADVSPSATPSVSGQKITWSYSASASVTTRTIKPATQTRWNSITVTYCTKEAPTETIIDDGNYFVVSNGKYLPSGNYTSTSTVPQAKDYVETLSTSEAWMFTNAGSSNEYTINDGSNRYLYTTEGDNKGVRTGSQNNANSVWVVTDNGDGTYYLQYKSTKRYLSNYNDSDWRSYKSLTAPDSHPEITLIPAGEITVKPEIVPQTASTTLKILASTTIRLTLSNFSGTPTITHSSSDSTIAYVSEIDSSNKATIVSGNVGGKATITFNASYNTETASCTVLVNVDAPSITSELIDGSEIALKSEAYTYTVIAKNFGVIDNAVTSSNNTTVAIASISSTGTAGTYELSITTKAVGTSTITTTISDEDGRTANSVIGITVVEGTITYNQVASEADLEVGAMYTFYSNGKVPTHIQTNKYYPVINASLTSGSLTSGTGVFAEVSNINTFILVPGKTAGTYSLWDTTKNQYLTAAYAKEFTFSNSFAETTININADSHVANISYGAKGSIYYNTSSPRFLNYTSAQASIYLFKRSTNSIYESSDTKVFMDLISDMRSNCNPTTGVSAISSDWSDVSGLFGSIETWGQDILKNQVVNIETDKESTNIYINALCFYDYTVNKYNDLTDFLSRKTSGGANQGFGLIGDNNITIILSVLITLSMVSMAGLYIVRKRKQI